jgi:predicted RNA-binding Zn-ribbon protein involved in translation (DUF1610 family)
LDSKNLYLKKEGVGNVKIPAKACMKKARKRNYLPMGALPSQLECPRCGAKLTLWGVVAAVPQIYICQKCGYRGSVGLEPGKVRLGKLKRI